MVALEIVDRYELGYCFYLGMAWDGMLNDDWNIKQEMGGDRW